MQKSNYSCTIWRKIPLTMKLSFFFILICVFSSYAAGSHAQDKKITVTAQNASFEEIINIIEEQSNYVFFYNSEDLNSSQNYSFKFTERDIFEILDILVSKSTLTYKVDKNYIFLDKKEVQVLQQQQRITVTGNITDQENNPLPGVTITVEGSTRGVITDNEGNYSIDVSPSAILQISFIGMQTQNIPVQGKKTINVVLIESSQLLEEVQIVGFGQQKKGSVTSSVASVEGT